MNTPRIVIHVKGGCVTGIVSDAEVQAHVIDWDNAKAGELDILDPVGAGVLTEEAIDKELMHSAAKIALDHLQHSDPECTVSVLNSVLNSGVLKHAPLKILLIAKDEAECGSPQKAETLLELALAELTSAADGKHHCESCGWTGSDSDVKTKLVDILELNQRIVAGGEVPSGECPRCRALRYLVKKGE